jgi:hypothetical protein
MPRRGAQAVIPFISLGPAEAGNVSCTLPTQVQKIDCRNEPRLIASRERAIPTNRQEPDFDCPQYASARGGHGCFSPLFSTGRDILDSQILARNHGIGEKGA